MPSHFRIERTLPTGWTCRRSGSTTVGPVTIGSAPKRIDRLASRARIQYAAAPTSTQVANPPGTIRLRHRAPDLLEPGDPERPPLEEDDRYGHRRQRQKAVAQQFPRLDEAGDRAREEAEDQEQQDRRQPQTPRKPLPADTEPDDARDALQEFVAGVLHRVLHRGRGFRTVAKGTQDRTSIRRVLGPAWRIARRIAGAWFSGCITSPGTG